MTQDPPKDADQLAQVHQLGAFKESYTTGVSYALVFLVFFLVVSYAVVFALNSLTLATKIVGSVMFLLILAFLFGLELFYRKLRVYVYANGVVRLHGRKRQIAKWDGIREVKHVKKKGVHHIFVQLDNRTKLVFPTQIFGIEDLGATIDREVDQHSMWGQLHRLMDDQADHS